MGPKCQLRWKCNARKLYQAPNISTEDPSWHRRATKKSLIYSERVRWDEALMRSTARTVAGAKPRIDERLGFKL